jgi:hypothetical protein
MAIIMILYVPFQQQFPLPIQMIACFSILSGIKSGKKSLEMLA